MKAEEKRYSAVISNIDGLTFNSDDGKVAIYSYPKIKGVLFYVDKVTKHVRLYTLPCELITKDLLKAYDGLVVAYGF